MKKVRLFSFFLAVWALAFYTAAPVPAKQTDQTDFVILVLLSGADRMHQLYQETTETDPARQKEIREYRAQKELNRAIAFVSNGASRLRLLFYDVTNEITPEAAAYVERMRNDPAILEAVAEAVDSRVWWGWFDTLPVDHEIRISQKTALEWLEDYAALTEEERQAVQKYVNNNPLRFAFVDPDAPSIIFDAPDFR